MPRQAEQERLLSWLRELGAEVRVTGTPERPFFCLTGDISRIDPSLAARFPAVEDVLRLTEPYPLCSRRLHPSRRSSPWAARASAAGTSA